MTRWVALLRAVNVGQRQYPMAALRATLTGAGYTDVQTYIQSGNVFLGSPLRSAARLEAQLDALLSAERGFTVQTVCLRPPEIVQVAAEAAELSAEHRPQFGHYVSFLKTVPDAAVVRALEALSREGERVVVRGRVVHQLYDVEYHKARTTNTSVEKVAGVATNRNARVVMALADRWGGVPVDEPTGVS